MGMTRRAKKSAPVFTPKVEPGEGGVLDYDAEVQRLIPVPLLFNVVVMPKRPPKHSRGGVIELTAETKDAEQFANQVGKVMQIGSLAYASKTPGLDYSKEQHIPKVGDWVLYAKHAGSSLTLLIDTFGTLADPDNIVKLLILSDTDILGTLTEEQVKHLTGWAV
jgi:co-chaperonin GroES (HSP10)